MTISLSNLLEFDTNRNYFCYKDKKMLIILIHSFVTKKRYILHINTIYT